MFRHKRPFVFVACLSVLMMGGAVVWNGFLSEQQSSVRLSYKFHLKELRAALESYYESHKRFPGSLDELRAAGGISRVDAFEAFKYVGGMKGVLAFQREPLREVRRGEPWGGKGRVAKEDIPAARLVLFVDGAITFVPEATFQNSYGNFLLSIGLEELIPRMDLSRWYSDMSGYRPDPNHFGAYVMLPVGQHLYIGFGTGLPTLGDGALLARFDGKSLESIGSLGEEGLHEMLWDHHTGLLHIAGTDPSWPDDWSAGNHYTYDPSGPKPLVKHRDPRNGQVNVIHTWGLWISEDHVLYAAVSSHDGSFVRDRNLIRRLADRLHHFFNDSYYSAGYGATRMGQILSSHDKGKTWRHLSDLGDFRAYTISGLDDKLYATYTDMPASPCKLAVSHDGGRTWRDVSQVPLQTARLIRFQGKLLAVSFDGKSIYTVSAQAFHKYELPPTLRIVSTFNNLAVGDGFVYALCEKADGRYCILRTSNFVAWDEIVSTHEKLVSISLWKAQNALVVSGAGTAARLWKVPMYQQRPS